MIIHNFFIFWYGCFSQQKQSQKSCGRLVQLWSSSPSPNHTSMNLGNDNLNLFCTFGIQVRWTHLPTLLYPLDLILQLEAWEFPCSVRFYLLDILQHLISENFHVFLCLNLGILTTLEIWEFMHSAVFELGDFFLLSRHAFLLYSFSLKVPSFTLLSMLVSLLHLGLRMSPLCFAFLCFTL